jgi:hypothetical protein
MRRVYAEPKLKRFGAFRDLTLQTGKTRQLADLAPGRETCNPTPGAPAAAACS